MRKKAIEQPAASADDWMQQCIRDRRTQSSAGTAGYLHGIRVVLNAGVADLQHVFDAGLAEGLRYTNAPSLLREGHKQRVGRKRGGNKTAGLRKMEANNWQDECRAQAARLIKEGRNPRDLAVLLAKRYRKDPSTIRRALKMKRADA
ncbi:hypothetical protein [Metallibacterium sp.]|uniref:hypothetical protein n=1 Tax=Metallibacterium sp. TaxID=2940281 RepID=UPI00263149F7|nr:hypothetical protein [Metallibacterium sp.]